MGRGRRALFAALTTLLTASVCAALVSAYYARRVREYASVDYAFQGDFPIEKDDEVGFIPVRNGATLRQHPRMGLRYHVFTSDRRARVDAPGAATPSPVAILTVGCSYSWGQGVENEETYTALLGRRMQVPVANLAFAGYGTTQSLIMLKRSLDLRPRVVIYGFIDTHLERNLWACAPNFGPACLPCPSVAFDKDSQPFIRLPAAELFDLNRRFWLDFYGREGSVLRRAALVAEADLWRWTTARDSGLSEDPVARVRALTYLLGEMHEKTRSAGATLLVVHIPNLKPSGERRVPGALKKALRRLRGPGWELLDLTPAVAAHYSLTEPSSLVGRDRHPNVIGHRLIADEVEAFIRSRGLLVEGLTSAYHPSRAPGTMPTSKP